MGAEGGGGGEGLEELGFREEGGEVGAGGGEVAGFEEVGSEGVGGLEGGCCAGPDGTHVCCCVQDLVLLVESAA